jgi:nucleotide-binding universal stress UspA family protein
MYARVLWATDASAIADRALAEALELLDTGGTLIAFHVDERFPGARVGGTPVAVDEPDRRAALAEQVRELQERGIDAQLVIETTHRSAASEIANAADRLDADVIVCGTRGLGTVAGTVAGSVALRLPHLATCPVVVVPEKARRRALHG